MDTIKVALIDDQRLFRDGVAALLKDTAGLELTGVYEHGRAFLDAITNEEQCPDVALVDMNMPEMNGVDLTLHLQRENAGIRVIVLTAYDQERFVFKMIEAGACGYLLKNCDAKELIEAIRSVHRSGYYFNDSFMNAMKNGSRYKSSSIHNINHIPIELTEREKEVLILICKELTNAEIAEQLYISARTVDGHRNNLLAKTGARNTAGLVLFAVTNGLINILPH